MDQEKEHQKREDQELGKSQRELKNGRNFLWNVMRFHDNDDYRDEFDRIFPKAPGVGI